MLNTKRILKMARKWKKVAALGRKRIISMRTNDGSDESSTSVASTGHLFVYTTDRKRFMIPLEYLTNKIFIELFRMSDEEFGLPSDGPITLPCDAFCMEYIISLLQKGVSRVVQRAVLTSIFYDRCSLYSLPLPRCDQQQLILYGF